MAKSDLVCLNDASVLPHCLCDRLVHKNGNTVNLDGMKVYSQARARACVFACVRVRVCLSQELCD